MKRFKFLVMAAVVAAGLTVGGGLVAASPASAATGPSTGPVVVVSPPPANNCLYGNCSQQTFCFKGTCVPGPAPACVKGYCIPQTPICSTNYCVPTAWYDATSVLTNEGLDQLGSPVVGLNPTPVDEDSCVNLSQTVNGSITASLNGTFGVSNGETTGAVAELQPGVSATVGYSYTFGGTFPCPAETNVTVYFGINFVQTTGTVYQLDAKGNITSTPGVIATVPTGFAYYPQYTPAVVGS